MKLKKQQRLHRSVALYRWQITMRLAAEVAAFKRKRRPASPTTNLEN